MKRTAKKFKSFQAEEKSDIEQHVRMSPEERQRVAKKLRERVYGKTPPDVRSVKAPAWKSPTFPKTSKSS